MLKEFARFVAASFIKCYQFVKAIFFPEKAKPTPEKKEKLAPKGIRRSSSYKTISTLLPPSTEHTRSYSDPAKKRLSFNSVTYVCDTKGMVTHQPLFGHNVKNEKYRPKKKTLAAKMLEYFNKGINKKAKTKPSRHSC